MADTIFAISSGSPPAAIGIVRISGPEAGAAVEALVGGIPEARRATLRKLRATDRSVLDEALVLWFPGPATATGEDLAEFHCHGGKAVLAAVEKALAELPGCRRAEPGEFTRRAFANGVIDLAQAEGLGDLLAAETELQRRAAQEAVGGRVSQQFEEWRDRLMALSAQVEAVLDFDEEDDVSELDPSFYDGISELTAQWRAALDAPRAKRLRDGIRVVFAGPPNSGKSSLFNTLLDEGAAIVSAEAGTTRDVIERPIAFAGVPFTLVDTAGLREEGAGEIERVGISRAQEQLDRADIVLWLGPDGAGPRGAWEIASFADQSGAKEPNPRHLVSSETKMGIDGLIADLIEAGSQLVPKLGDAALNERQGHALASAAQSLTKIGNSTDPLIVGELLRSARSDLDRLTGRHSTDDMLDALFGRFCIGK